MISNKLKVKKILSKLWDCKSKTIFVGFALIVSFSSCLNNIVYKQNLPYNTNRGLHIK